MVIIPDYILTNLPFEALITKPMGLNQNDNLNFLLNEHIVVYAPSWKVWDHNRKEPLPQINHRAAFFTYNEVESPVNLYEWGTEWHAMKSFFRRKATLYDRNFCTKEKFMQVAYRYKILHFSLHGESNPLRLRENKLFFQLKDTLKTDTLSGVELRDLSLQGKLVILSACKTNDGKITPEGMYSLSRAFLQAGSACTISTMWSVNEQATSVILARFYVHLAQNSPWVALCKAKRDYLKTHSLKPYLWAGLVATI